MESLNNKKYLITPSLLNSWLYIYEAPKNVVESENDEICLEDKRELASKKAYEDFINTLNRIPSEPNKYMQAGIDFEEECYKGNTCISPIIENGAFQISGTKDVIVNRIKFVMYGRLDVLKGGIIYDIKRIWKYSPQKYLWSSQHGFYLDLFPNANKFEYLAFDGNKLHIETYYRYECVPTEEHIKNFIEFLKTNDLLDVYFAKWESKY